MRSISQSARAPDSARRHGLSAGSLEARAAELRAGDARLAQQLLVFQGHDAVQDHVALISYERLAIARELAGIERQLKQLGPAAPRARLPASLSVVGVLSDSSRTTAGSPAIAFTGLEGDDDDDATIEEAGVARAPSQGSASRAVRGNSASPSRPASATGRYVPGNSSLLKLAPSPSSGMLRPPAAVAAFALEPLVRPASATGRGSVAAPLVGHAPADTALLPTLSLSARSSSSASRRSASPASSCASRPHSHRLHHAPRSLSLSSESSGSDLSSRGSRGSRGRRAKPHHRMRGAAATAAPDPAACATSRSDRGGPGRSSRVHTRSPALDSKASGRASPAPSPTAGGMASAAALDSAPPLVASPASLARRPSRASRLSAIRATTSTSPVAVPAPPDDVNASDRPRSFRGGTLCPLMSSRSPSPAATDAALALHGYSYGTASGAPSGLRGASPTPQQLSALSSRSRSPAAAGAIGQDAPSLLLITSRYTSERSGKRDSAAGEPLTERATKAVSPAAAVAFVSAASELSAGHFPAPKQAPALATAQDTTVDIGAGGSDSSQMFPRPHSAVSFSHRSAATSQRLAADPAGSARDAESLPALGKLTAPPPPVTPAARSDRPARNGQADEPAGIAPARKPSQSARLPLRLPTLDEEGGVAPSPGSARYDSSEPSKLRTSHHPRSGLGAVAEEGAAGPHSGGMRANAELKAAATADAAIQLQGSGAVAPGLGRNAAGGGIHSAASASGASGQQDAGSGASLPSGAEAVTAEEAAAATEEGAQAAKPRYRRTVWWRGIWVPATD